MRSVCGTHAPAAMADFMREVTCRRCLQSAARLIDEGLAEVSQVWRMHKDKSRTLIGEELALLGQNADVLAPAGEKTPNH